MTEKLTTCDICGQIAAIYTPKREGYAQMLTDHGMFCVESGDIVRDADGDGAWFVSVYDVCAQYGGPEEGGWDFTTRTRKASRQVPSLAVALAIVDEFPGHGACYGWRTLPEEPEGHYVARIFRGNAGPEHDDDDGFYA